MRRLVFALLVALLSLAMVTPAIAQSLEPKDLLLPQAALGRGDWRVDRESTEGSNDQVKVHLINYIGSLQGRPLRVVTFGVAVVPEPRVADVALTAMQRRLEQEEYEFHGASEFGDGDGLRAEVQKRDAVGTVYIFRVNRAVALVQVVGPASQATEVGILARSYAYLQEARLQAMLLGRVEARGPRDVVGTLEGKVSGDFDTYRIFYPGGSSVYTIEMLVEPRQAGLLQLAGFRVYNPTGGLHMTGGMTPGLEADVAGNLIHVDPGVYTVQVYNYNPRVDIDYHLRLRPKPPEGR
jgi:hypothetical protein